MKIRKRNLLLPSILLAGFIIRCIYLYYFKDSVFFNPYLLEGYDQRTFILWAKDILAHPWHVSGSAFYMAPLYSYFLAAVCFLFRGSLIAISVVQLLMDTAVCFFLYYIAKKIYNEWAGLAAAFLACFYRTSVVYASTVLSDGLIYFLYVLFIALVYFSLQKPNYLRWILSGVVLGLAALAKPTIAVFLPFLLLGLYLYPEKKLLPCNMKPKYQPAAILILLLFVSGMTILPVTIRNYYVSREFVPICTNGPINWHIGNSSDSLGLFHYPKGELLSPLSGAFWKLFFTKLNLFFTSYEWPQNLNVHLLEKVIPALKLAFIKFGFIVPLGAAGLLMLFRDWKKNFIFITFTLSNVLWVVLFFITDRYRLPAIGCFAVSGACLIIWSIEKFRRKKPLHVIPFWIAAAVFAFFFNTSPGPLIPEGSYRSFSGLSIKNIQHDLEFRDIKAAHKKAVAYFNLMPADYRANFFLAITLMEQGDMQNGILLLNRTLKLNPAFQPARDILSSLSH